MVSSFLPTSLLHAFGLWPLGLWGSSHVFILSPSSFLCSFYLLSFITFTLSVCGTGPGDAHARMLTSLTRVDVRAVAPRCSMQKSFGSPPPRSSGGGEPHARPLLPDAGPGTGGQDRAPLLKAPAASACRLSGLSAATRFDAPPAGCSACRRPFMRKCRDEALDLPRWLRKKGPRADLCSH